MQRLLKATTIHLPLCWATLTPNFKKCLYLTLDLLLCTKFYG